MNDIEPPVIYLTFDEADQYEAAYTGRNTAGRRVNRTRVAELAEQMKEGTWRLGPQLDEGSAAAAGPDYANRNRFLDSTPIRVQEAIRMIREAIAVARARGWMNRASRSPNGAGSTIPPAEVRYAGRVSYVVDPRHYLTNVTWSTQKARPEDLVDRIDQVVAEAESLIASIRSVQRTQRNRDDLRRMFGDQR